jgi:hypothetical protein
MVVREENRQVKIIVWNTHITRQLVKAHPNDVWLFGDNLLRTGMGGMAKEMRGEPNCIGVPTKLRPDMRKDAFFNDTAYDLAVSCIETALIVAVMKAMELGGDIIIPCGLGRGLAKLPEKSPKIWAYLQKKLQELETL